MTPLFTRSSPWAVRTLLLTGLLCLPLTGAVMYGLFEHQRLELETSQVQQQLAQRQQVLRKLREAEQRRLRQAQQLQAVPPAIKLLDNIGSVLTPDIALLSIDVIASKGDARLTVNAGNLDACSPLASGYSSCRRMWCLRTIASRRRAILPGRLTRYSTSR